MKLPKEVTRVTPLSKALAMLIFIVFPLATFFIGMRYQARLDLLDRQIAEQSLTIARAPTPTPQSIDTSTWKTYTNSKIKLAFKYPTTWTITDRQKPQEGIDEKIEVIGSEGRIDITAWNEGYGGGCDENMHMNFQIFGQTQNICHWVDENGIEYWNGMDKKLPTGFIMSINSQANAPSQKNRQTVLNILSTFNSTDQAQPTPTCIPRPKCLDAAPRCMIAEPANGWCQ